MISINYKNFKNEFQNNGEITTMTIINKKGKEFSVEIDTEDLEKVKEAGSWFAEWHKDFNCYLVQNISNNLNKNDKPSKISLQNFIMNKEASVPVKHINENALDNKKANLDVFNKDEVNETEKIDETTTAIILKDKFGNKVAKALVSNRDLDRVVNEDYTWVTYKTKADLCVVANTTEGRIHLDKLLMEPNSNQIVHHINLNPLDNRIENLELKEMN